MDGFTYFDMFATKGIEYILVIVFLVIFIRIMYLPAIVLLGIWFALQIFSAIGGGPGVAWYAHIGGFVAGIILVGAFVTGGRPRRRPRPARVTPLDRDHGPF